MVCFHFLHKRQCLLQMNSVRQPIFICILVLVHCSIALFGESIHLTQCASGVTVENACATCSCRSHRLHSRSSAIAASTNDRSPEDQPSTEDPQSEHASGRCAICEALSTAAEPAQQFLGVVQSDAVDEVLAPTQDSAVRCANRAAQSRGPPPV